MVASSRATFVLDDPAPPSTAPVPTSAGVTDGLAAPSLAEDPREAAARVLLAAMPPDLARLVTEMAYQHLRLPLWAALVGACFTLNEWGQFIAVTLPPSLRGEVDRLPTPFAQAAASVCAWCKQPFRPRHWKQTYCSSTPCGDAAAEFKRLQRAEALAAAGAAFEPIVADAAPASTATRLKPANA